MKQYRLNPPGRPKILVGLIGLVVTLLILPGILMIFVPELSKATESKPLVLGSSGYDWKIPVYNRDGSELICSPETDAMELMKTWECDDKVKVSSLIVSGSKDADNTLRRMTNLSPVVNVSEDTRIFHSKDDKAQILVSKSANPDLFGSVIAMSMTGSGDHEDDTMVVIVRGKDPVSIGLLIWSTLAKEGGFENNSEPSDQVLTTLTEEHSQKEQA